MIINLISRQAVVEESSHIPQPIAVCFMVNRTAHRLNISPKTDD